MKQLPAVGRIVHFYTANASEQSNGRGTGPYAAIIVGICDNTDDPNQMVNVNVFADHGADFCAGSVHGLNTEGADPKAITEGRYWVWPPHIASVTTESSAGELTITSSVGVNADGDAFKEWAAGLGDNDVAEAPTGLEGRVGKSVMLSLDDAKALRSYIDGSKNAASDGEVDAIKTLHWLITDAEA